MMQDILISFDAAVLDLRVDTLRWDLSDYNACAQQLCSLCDLPILSYVHKLAKHDNHGVVAMQDESRLLPIDQLPFELFETLLVSATGHLFAISAGGRLALQPTPWQQ